MGKMAGMDNRVLWLRIAYWTGALADAIMVVAMLVPELNRILVLNRVADFDLVHTYICTHVRARLPNR